ncbi:hypothetical protein J3Q64DRAFT_1775794 [Phycomyces blakesleeanus]|uniref:Uncharacterized protein n=1 Tax=Phycomyces blakesleeanus TaxID=4837 RepID=A0ABR3AJ52_PHYBL
MDLDGDRWAKVIIIIYTTMSILQTLSLIMLHKQMSAFSIKEDEDEKIRNDDGDSTSTEGEDEKTLPNHEDSVSTEDEDKKTQPNDGDSTSVEDGRKHFELSTDILDHEDVSISSMFIGSAASLLIGIWADYNSHSVTEWLVLSWIISPFIITLIIFTAVIIDNDILGILLIIITVIASVCVIGCLIGATIIGYLPK